MLVFIYTCEYEIRKAAKSKSNPLQYLSQRQFDSQMLANEIRTFSKRGKKRGESN